MAPNAEGVPNTGVLDPASGAGDDVPNTDLPPNADGAPNAGAVEPAVVGVDVDEPNTEVPAAKAGVRGVSTGFVAALKNGEDVSDTPPPNAPNPESTLPNPYADVFSWLNAPPVGFAGNSAEGLVA